MPEVLEREAHDSAFCFCGAIKRQQIPGKRGSRSIKRQRRVLRRKLQLPLTGPCTVRSS